MIALVSEVYASARLRRMYLKGKDPTVYWIWFAVGFATLIGITAFFLISIKKFKQNKKAKKASINSEKPEIAQ